MRSLASVASTARPMAPPTCTLVLMRPDARPESLGVAPDIASAISDGKPRPAPMPMKIVAGITCVAYVASTGVQREEQQPEADRDQAHDAASPSGRSASSSGPESFSDIVPITIVEGRKARPTSSGS